MLGELSNRHKLLLTIIWDYTRSMLIIFVSYSGTSFKLVCAVGSVTNVVHSCQVPTKTPAETFESMIAWCALRVQEIDTGAVRPICVVACVEAAPPRCAIQDQAV